MWLPPSEALALYLLKSHSVHRTGRKGRRGAGKTSGAGVEAGRIRNREVDTQGRGQWRENSDGEMRHPRAGEPEA